MANRAILGAEEEPPEEIPSAQPETPVDFADANSLRPDFAKDAELIKSTLQGDEEPEAGIDDMELDASKLFEASKIANLVKNTKTAMAAMAAKAAHANKTPLTKTQAIEEKRKFLEGLIAKGGGEVRLAGTKRGASRLVFSDPKKDIAAMIDKLLAGMSVGKVPPKQFHNGAASSKYTTYFVQLPAGIQTRIPKELGVDPWIKVVFAGGANRGQKFEADIKEEIAARKGPAWEALTAKLSEFFGARPEDVLEIEKNVGGNLHVKRGFEGSLLNLGPVISDLNLLVQMPDWLPELVHVSIKDVNGNTISNNGYAGGFVQDAEGVIVPSTGKLTIEHFLESLGVDKQRVAAGLNDYKNQQVTTTPFLVTPQFDAKTVFNYIAAQISYGYIYFRNNDDGTYTILNFTNPRNVFSFIGMPKSVTIRYPHFLAPTPGKASKQCSIMVTTTTGKFLVEIRNSQGGLIPNQLNLSTR